MKSTMATAIVVAFALQLVVEKTNPSDFSLTARVVSVTSSKQPVGLRSNDCTGREVITGRAEDAAADAKAAACAVKGGPKQEVIPDTIYVMTTEIGDSIYEIEGTRLEIGTYQARIRGDFVDFLLKDRKGKPKSFPFRIVGQRSRFPSGAAQQ